MLQGKIKPDRGVESNDTTTLDRIIRGDLWQFEQ